MYLTAEHMPKVQLKMNILAPLGEKARNCGIIRMPRELVLRTYACFVVMQK